jgi:transposase
MDRCPSNLPIAEQSFRRVEILSGPAQRRSTEEKAAVVAASLAPEAVGRQVRCATGCTPISSTHGAAELASVDGCDGPTAEFVPVAVTRRAVGARSAIGPVVEIALSDAVVRVPPGTEMDFLSAALRAVKL